MSNYSNLQNLQKNFSRGTVSCLDVVNSFLKKIEEKKNLNIFLELFSNEAIHLAKKIDKKIKNNSAGKLAGLVIGIKDNICYKDHFVTASSKILKNFQSKYSATVIDRLLKHDAIIIGRINCDEFAMSTLR